MPLEKIPSLPALTAFRFLAALAIVVHHCNGVFWPAAELGPLDVGVSFFFVLSGFILTYVYRDVDLRGAALRRFYRARLARIVPLHVVCLLLTVLLVRIPEPFNVAVLLSNALLLHAWIPLDRFFFSFNYVAWSLSTELFFYALLPFLLARLDWLGRALGLAVLAVLLLTLVSYGADLPDWDTTHNRLSATGLLYAFPPARLAEFLLGVATALLFLKRAAGNATSCLRATVTEGAAVLIFLLAFRYFFVAVTAVVTQLLGVLEGNATSSGAAEPLGDFAALLGAEWGIHVGLAPFAALLIYVFAQQRGLISKLLSQRMPVFLGEISFALYLIHQITLRFVQQHFSKLDGTAFAVFLATILLLAVGLHVLIERPARRWLTRRGRQPVAEKSFYN